MTTLPDIIDLTHPYDTKDIDGFSPLVDARQYVETLRAQPKGGTCPCCNQHVKNYRYSISSSMAKALIALYHKNLKNKGMFISKEDLFKDIETKSTFGGGSFASMKRWGLIEQKKKSVDDKTKGRCSGFWRITEKGVAFVRNEITLPKYVHSYNNEVFKQDDSEMISITEALFSEGFDYQKVMSEAVANPD